MKTGSSTLLITSPPPATRDLEGGFFRIRRVRQLHHGIRTAELLDVIYTTIDWPLQTPNLKVRRVSSLVWFPF